MTLLVDGSNLLGRSGVDRHDPEAKRVLLQRISSLARRQRAKVILFFDGPKPAAFATSLGSVQVVFSGNRSADDLIRQRAEEAREPLTVVTSDQTLAARVRGRKVEIVDAHRFVRLIESPAEEGRRGQEEIDWESYFSDSENRNI